MKIKNLNNLIEEMKEYSLDVDAEGLPIYFERVFEQYELLPSQEKIVKEVIKSYWEQNRLSDDDWVDGYRKWKRKNERLRDEE